MTSYRAYQSPIEQRKGNAPTSPEQWVFHLREPRSLELIPKWVEVSVVGFLDVFGSHDGSELLCVTDKDHYCQFTLFEAGDDGFQQLQGVRVASFVVEYHARMEILADQRRSRRRAGGEDTPGI